MNSVDNTAYILDRPNSNHMYNLKVNITGALTVTNSQHTDYSHLISQNMPCLYNKPRNLTPTRSLILQYLMFSCW
jgi:hypothetical protein